MAKKHLNAWRVTAGTFHALYWTPYHAEQMASALRRHKPLAGVPVTVDLIAVPDDPLSRLTVSGTPGQVGGRAMVSF